MFKMKKSTAAIILSVAFSFSAQAAPTDRIESGWYVGADLGHTEIKPDYQAFLTEKESSDIAFAIHSGYRVSPHFAIEGTYADLGNYDYRLDICLEFCIPENFSQEVSISGVRWGLALEGSIPLGERFDAYAKTGFAHTRVNTEIHSLNTNSQSSDNSFDVFYGVGMRLHFDGPWSLRLQWDRTSDDELDSVAWWLGAEYQFSRR